MLEVPGALNSGIGDLDLFLFGDAPRSGRDDLGEGERLWRIIETHHVKGPGKSDVALFDEVPLAGRRLGDDAHAFVGEQWLEELREVVVGADELSCIERLDEAPDVEDVIGGLELCEELAALLLPACRECLRGTEPRGRCEPEAATSIISADAFVGEVANERGLANASLADEHDGRGVLGGEELLDLIDAALSGEDGEEAALGGLSGGAIRPELGGIIEGRRGRTQALLFLLEALVIELVEPEHLVRDAQQIQWTEVDHELLEPGLVRRRSVMVGAAVGLAHARDEGLFDILLVATSGEHAVFESEPGQEPSGGVGVAARGSDRDGLSGPVWLLVRVIEGVIEEPDDAVDVELEVLDLPGVALKPPDHSRGVRALEGVEQGAPQAIECVLGGGTSRGEERRLECLSEEAILAIATHPDREGHAHQSMLHE